MARRRTRAAAGGLAGQYLRAIADAKREVLDLSEIRPSSVASQADPSLAFRATDPRYQFEVDKARVRRGEKL